MGSCLMTLMATMWHQRVEILALIHSESFLGFRQRDLQRFVCSFRKDFEWVVAEQWQQ